MINVSFVLLTHNCLQVKNLPKYTSQVVVRFIKPLSQPYLDLATACGTNKSADVQTAVNKHKEAFERLLRLFCIFENN
jgi:predicted CopG family antitoxin